MNGSAVGPVTERERIGELDVLRGIALFQWSRSSDCVIGPAYNDPLSAFHPKPTISLANFADAYLTGLARPFDLNPKAAFAALLNITE